MLSMKQSIWLMREINRITVEYNPKVPFKDDTWEVFIKDLNKMDADAQANEDVRKAINTVQELYEVLNNVTYKGKSEGNAANK